jgi:hypothetical protein
MAIGNSYPIDKNVEDQDLFIGTKYSNRQTVNFPAESIVDYLNRHGKISIAGQMSFQFVTANPLQGTISFINLDGDGTPFSAITALRVAINDLGGQNVVDFLTYIVGSQIMISEQKEISFFGHYEIVSYTPDTIPGFYILNLNYIGGSGGLIENAYYDVSLFYPFPLGDKTFVFTQSTPANPWIITHNLDKFPSATMVLSTGQVGIADIVYIDQNSLTITFSGDESGKAYLN